MKTYGIIAVLLCTAVFSTTAVAQTYTMVQFIGTGSATWNDANNWVETLSGQYLPDPNILGQALGTNRLPDITQPNLGAAYIRNGASVTLDGGITAYCMPMYVGGPAAWDPNYPSPDPDFKYLPMPTSTLTIKDAGTTLIIDPNSGSSSGSSIIVGGSSQGGYSGTLNMQGGSINTSWLYLGVGPGATGIFNASGGTTTIRYRWNVGYAAGYSGSDGKIREGRGGYGEANISGNACIQNASALWIGLARTNITMIDLNGFEIVGGTVSLPSKFNMSGGVYKGTGNVTVGYGNALTVPWDPNSALAVAKGTMTVTGGSFVTAGELRPGTDGGNGTLEVLGGSVVVGNRIRMGYRGYDTGSSTLRMGGTGVLWIDGAIGLVTYEPNTTNGGLSTPRYIFDIDRSAADPNTLCTGFISSTIINLGATDELYVNALERPKEGDQFLLMEARSSTTGGFDDQITMLSSILDGLDPNYSTAFAYAWDDPNNIGPDKFRITFHGFTGGDANGDHKVLWEDLAALDANWGQSGMGWADGDFTGDDIVNQSDLDILNANWGWEIPEPATLSLLGLGGLVVIRRRRLA